MSYLARCPENAPELPAFKMPFGDALDPDNELVRMARLIPWPEIETLCSGLFAKKGRRAIPVRVAVGALLLKEMRRVGGDRPLVQMIRENPYAQYFLGFSEFRSSAPFDQSQMSYFRARISSKMSEINELIIRAKDKAAGGDGEAGGNGPEQSNKGKLVVDATVAPADIAYPTDCALIHKAIERAGSAIDSINAPDGLKRPYDNRDKMRSVFLEMAKAKRMKGSKRRKRMRVLADFLGRQLDYIEACLERPDEAFSSAAEHVATLNLCRVLRKLHGQQDEMLREKKHSVKDRIVSIDQPWVRPMVRGKLRAKTEFGVKVSAAVVDGYVRFEEESFDPYNESAVLQKQVEGYRARYGCYPESVHADKIYLTRGNRDYCREHGIRLSGRPLGRPCNDPGRKQESDAVYRADLKDRIIVEGKFGESKRNYSLDRVMAHLKETTMAVLHAVAAVMNLRRWLRAALLLLSLFRRTRFTLTAAPRPLRAAA